MRIARNGVLLLITLLIPITSILAQTPDSEEKTVVVLLKNGAKVRGLVLEDNPGKRIVVKRDSDQLEIKIPYKKIFRITDDAHYDSVRADFEKQRLEQDLQRVGRHKLQVVTLVGGVTDFDLAKLGGDVVLGFETGRSTFLGLVWATNSIMVAWLPSMLSVADTLMCAMTDSSCTASSGWLLPTVAMRIFQPTSAEYRSALVRESGSIWMNRGASLSKLATADTGAQT